MKKRMKILLALLVTVSIVVVTPVFAFGADKLVVKNEAGATTFKVEDNGTITNSSALLVNGATTWGSAPMVLGQNPLNRGIIIADKAESNPKIISIGWNVGNTFDYMEILAVHHGVAFKNIVLAPTGGNVGIGTTAPEYLIETGGAYCNGSTWVNASSRKYKENIKELTADEAMDTLKGLNPVKFNYKISPDEQDVGFIAEDAPTLVASKDRKGMSPMDPHVVIQNNLFNRSRINTVVVCALTSNVRLAKSPGNVTLNKGEANLPKKSVVNISQIFTVNKSDLSEKIGMLSKMRIFSILQGIRLITEPREID